MNASIDSSSTTSRPLRSRIVCPHCWVSFAPEQSLWISQHPNQRGDPRLGRDQQRRFLPTRFTVDGQAMDPDGFICQDLACPNCHLGIPRACIELPATFVSIAGAPACGKSYFLTAMTWQLRQVLPRRFALSFTDADPVSNRLLNQYEELQFLNSNHDAIVRLEKTAEQGDLYDSVQFDEHAVNFPRPFLFAIRATENHPLRDRASKLARILCLYDNAGESFQPGKDSAMNPVTRHLAQSESLLFLLDPTQDPRFREACRARSHNPQVVEGFVTSRQETILQEMITRIRRHLSLSTAEIYDRPLVVVVTKLDAWRSLLPKPLPAPWVASRQGDSYCALDLEAIDAVSAQVRQLLWSISPEFVAAAEGFFRQVVFVPVSATGGAPERDPKSSTLGLRPRNMRPVWVEVPLLYALCRWSRGLIPYFARSSTSAETRLSAGNVAS